MAAKCGIHLVHKPQDPAQIVAQIVFVHGLFGDPFKTWTGYLYEKSKRKEEASRPQSRSSGLNGSAGSQQDVNNDWDPTSVSWPSLLPQVVPNGSTGGHQDAKKGRNSTGVFWPSLLPQVVPNVEILTWGYDADIDHFLGSAGQNTIHEHARTLLSDLVDYRDKDCKIPILFVVHSLGGIVVKDSVNQSLATIGTRLKEIAPNVRGIVFLGTPHRGSHVASLGKYAYKITLAASKRPNLRLLTSLEPNSEVLNRVSDDFSQSLLKHDLKICSFREELETRKLFVFNTLVVDADSAKIGDGREEIGSIPANHSKMTKFSSVYDVGFKRVSARLRYWVNDLEAEMNPEIHEQYFQDALQSLEDPAARARLDEVKPSHEDTFRWLFDENVVPFVQWLRSAKEGADPIFFIQGKPGSGKSTLMKFSMAHQETISILYDSGPLPWTSIGYFFHDRGSLEVQKNLTGMIQELLYQTLQAYPQLFPTLRNTYLDLVRRQKTNIPKWDLKTLQTSFETIVVQTEHPLRILAFVDALDEKSGDKDELIRFIQTLSQGKNNVVQFRVCVASRPWPIFTSAFGQVPGLAIDHHTRSDIREYTFSRLSDALHNNDAEEATIVRLRELAETVSQRARGVFIWVRLIVDELTRNLRDGTSFSNLETIVGSAPDELNDLYRRTFERIDEQYKLEGFALLSVVLCSHVFLDALELIACVRLGLKEYARISSFLKTDISDRSTGGLDSLIEHDCIKHLLKRSLFYSQDVSGGIFWRPWNLDAYNLREEYHQLKQEYLDINKSAESQALRQILSRCGGLLEPANSGGRPALASQTHGHASKIQFLHQTTKEWFLKYVENNWHGLNPYQLGFACLICTGSIANEKEFLLPLKTNILYHAKKFEVLTGMASSPFMYKYFRHNFEGIKLFLEQHHDTLKNYSLGELSTKEDSGSVDFSFARRSCDALCISAGLYCPYRDGETAFNVYGHALAIFGPSIVPVDVCPILDRVRALLQDAPKYDDPAPLGFNILLPWKDKFYEPCEHFSYRLPFDSASSLASLLLSDIGMDPELRSDIIGLLLEQSDVKHHLLRPFCALLEGIPGWMSNVNIYHYIILFENATNVQRALKFGLENEFWNIKFGLISMWHHILCRGDIDVIREVGKKSLWT